MKRNAIVRIILFSLIIAVLVGILLTGIGVRLYTFQVDHTTENYTHGAGQIPAQEVRDIEIEWASGSITLETADTDVITFHETGSKNADPLVFRQNGDKLIIQYQANINVFGFTSNFGKDLVITVPHDWKCGELTVDAASADLTVNNFSASEVDLNLASGDSRFTDCKVSELNLECASGEVYYVGTLNTLDCDTASGKVTAIFDNIPKSIDFDGVSGDLELTLPADAGFTVGMDAISGNFYSDFETTNRNGRYICGNGACKIDVDGISGSVTIRKGDAHRPKFS